MNEPTRQDLYPYRNMLEQGWLYLGTMAEFDIRDCDSDWKPWIHNGNLDVRLVTAYELGTEVALLGRQAIFVRPKRDGTSTPDYIQLYVRRIVLQGGDPMM